MINQVWHLCHHHTRRLRSDKCYWIVVSVRQVQLLLSQCNWSRTSCQSKVVHNCVELPQLLQQMFLTECASKLTSKRCGGPVPWVVLQTNTSYKMIPCSKKKECTSAVFIRSHSRFLHISSLTPLQEQRGGADWVISPSAPKQKLQQLRIHCLFSFW